MSSKKINQLFNFEKGVLQSSKCIEGDYDFITAAADWKTHKEYSHDCEALIFAAAASGSLGRTHYVNGKFISSDLCFILTPKEPEKLPVDLKFYYIIFNLYKNEIVAATKAGTSKEAIGLKVFGEYELPYFDIFIQHKVKAEFGKAEALKKGLIDEYNYQLTQLEILNQAILQEAVQGKLVPQDPNDEPASELLKRIKAEKAKSGKKEKPLPPIKTEEIPFEIPENWVWCRLGEIGESTIGIIFKPSQVGKIGIPVLRANNVQNGKIDYADLISVNTEVREKQIANIGDILLCVRSGSNNLIGKAAMIEKEGMSFGAFMSLYRSEFNSYILKFMHSDIFKKQINDKKSTGINQLTQGTLNNIMIPLPPLSEQKRIVAEIEKQLTKTKQLKEHIIANQQATEQLLKGLLHQAFEVKEMEEV